MLSNDNGVSFRAVMALILLCIVQASSFECWMCRNGAVSFDICDKKKEKEDCTRQGLDRCGTFSYENKTGFRVYAKSCTSKALCSANSTFCSFGGKNCRVQCCDTDLCNVQVGFATTIAPTTTQRPTTTVEETSTESTTTTEQPSTNTKTVSTASAQPTTEADEDCSWVDSHGCPMFSSVTMVFAFFLLRIAMI
ncbi:uncharacterized protein LOC110240106 [Exaiptasia diaphana]|uniref:Uncharacterized protein n=1 Tax=Exaiptasia diaphana TaxID=2652724 RepID=A0A913XAN6_EXADI|nr:uncharacterized protein LOC110240106 [Exaiptasia diaphana]